MTRSWAALLLLGGACGGPTQQRPPAEGATATVAAEVVPLALEAVSPDPLGSTVVVAKLGQRTVALVADADEPSVVVVDLDSRQVLGRTPLDGTPAQLLVTREGRVLVAERDRARVAMLEPGETTGVLRERATVATDDEPFGLAETRDGTILVTCAVSHVLRGFDAGDLRRRFAVDLPPEPRAVLASPRTGRAYVAHVGAPLVSVVDLASPGRGFARLDLAAAVPTEGAPVQGYSLAASPGAEAIVAPHAAALTGRLEVRTRSAYGDDRLVAEVGATAIVRESDDGGRRVVSGASPDCLLPRAVLFPRPSSILVACADSDGVEEIAVDGAPRSHERPPRATKGHWEKKLMAVESFQAFSARPPPPRRWLIGDGVTGLALDPAGARVVAWAQGARQLGVFAYAALPSASPVASVRIPSVAGEPLRDARVVRGRALFHRTGDSRIASDGRACASCHPDGLDDGLTWATPDGPRQTPSLRGRLAATAPYGWLGRSASLRAHLSVTMGRLGGSGLADDDAADLIAFVESLRAPARTASAGDRGREVFAARCASCHSSWQGFTDGERHDVGSRARGDLSASFDTPSLDQVGSTAPYFHDGRYPTLASLLAGSQGTMWHPPRGGLPPSDRDALLAYLQTL